MKCFAIPVIIGASGIVTKGLKNIWNNTRKAFSRFCTTDIAHNKESATVWNMKPEWWGAPMVQDEKYQRKENLWYEFFIIIIIIIIIITTTTTETYLQMRVIESLALIIGVQHANPWATLQLPAGVWRQQHRICMT